MQQDIRRLITEFQVHELYEPINFLKVKAMKPTKCCQLMKL